MTMEEFQEKVCKTALNGLEPDSCSSCPYGSYDGVCQHSEHPKRRRNNEHQVEN